MTKYAILGNPRFPVPCQLYELLQMAFSSPTDLNWEHYNSLRRVQNVVQGFIALANNLDASIFPDLPSTDPVTLYRMYSKLFTEISAMMRDCPEGQYKELVRTALEGYDQKPKQPPQKRAKETLTEDGYILSEFKTLQPYQATKITEHGKVDGDSAYGEYLAAKEPTNQKAYWEYLFKT